MKAFEGVNMWRCEICGREFKNKNQSHSCKSFRTIDEYIAQFSPHDQNKLQVLRELINKLAPEAVEKMSWNMPTFFQYNNLVHFVMQKNHIGFHVGPTAVKAFENELLNFHFNKGTIHLPNDQAFPHQLIEKIVQSKVEMHAH